MNDEVTIAIPRARIFGKEPVCVKTLKKRKHDKITTKLSEATLQKYTLPEPKPLTGKSLKNDGLFLSYVSYAKKQSSLMHKQRLAIGLIKKYKIQYIDLRKRLHVDHPVDDVFTVTDIDETFFSCINGRPLLEHNIPVYKSLKIMLSKHLRLRHEIGCKNDCILNIEANHRREIQIYDLSLKKYKEQVKLFDTFISDDYQKSMEFLKKCDVLENKVLVEVQDLRNLANDKFLTISRLVGLDYLYGLQQKYGRFLYYLSPPSWRSQHREFARSIEIEAMGFDLGANNDEDTFSVIFEKMRKECDSGLIKPVLFFKEPEHLTNLFETFEKQQLNHITYLDYLKPHAQKLIKGIKQLKEYNIADSAMVVDMIKHFQAQLEFAQEREAQLKMKFFKVLNGLFFESVGAAGVLKIKTHLEFCYEKVFIDHPFNMSISAIARVIENDYMDYCRKLDEMHSNKVKQATNQYIEAEKKKMKRAQKATRELRMFAAMEKALVRSFAPITNRTSQPQPPPPVQRKDLPPKCVSSKANAPKKKTHELTETEVEYLSLFTDWNKDEDPARYIHFADDGEETQASVASGSKNK